jgi:hypothetical protein
MVNLREILQVLFPDITFGPFPESEDFKPDYDCVISEDGIEWWGREEPQPSKTELLEVEPQDIDEKKTENHIADLKTQLGWEVDRRKHKIIPHNKEAKNIKRGAKLAYRIAAGTATQAEVQEATELDKFDDDYFEPIDNAADTIESEIESGAVVTVDQIKTHQAWPV